MTDHYTTQIFMQYDYAEAKDLCKTFLTLITGTLVFSLTFSEKVTDFRSAPTISKVLLVFTWTLMLGALVCVGIGLALSASAASNAMSYFGEKAPFPYPEQFQVVYYWLVTAGVSYVLSLVALIAASIISIWSKRPTEIGQK